jgi:membrane associated rhomboid family serine protease
MSVAEEKSRRKIFMGSDGNALVNLIVLITISFVLLNFVYVIYIMSELDTQAYIRNVFNWFVLPADFSKLGSRPWTLITHMFVHESFFQGFQGVFHMIGNLLWLWAFGYILQDLAGNRKLIPVFLYGGFVGGLFYMIAYNLIGRLHPGLENATLLGSNAAVMAVAVATTTVSPDYRLFPMINGGIPLWILTVLFVIIDFAGIPGNNPAIYVAHISAAAVGFLFIYSLRKGKDWSDPINGFFDWFGNLFNPDKPKKTKTKVKDEFFYNLQGKSPFKKTSNLTQSRIDSILDKINQQGYHFLTDEEKEILKRASEDDFQ